MAVKLIPTKHFEWPIAASGGVRDVYKWPSSCSPQGRTSHATRAPYYKKILLKTIIHIFPMIFLVISRIIFKTYAMYSFVSFIVLLSYSGLSKVEIQGTRAKKKNKLPRVQNKKFDQDTKFIILLLHRNYSQTIIY